MREIGLGNAIPLLGRAEEITVQPCEGAIAQAMARPERALEWMIPWIAPGGWIAIATSASAAGGLQHPDLVQEQVLRYSAPRETQRSVWIGRRPASGARA